MDKTFEAILWKTGASIVFTVPSKLSKDMDLKYFEGQLDITVAVGGESFKILKRPWKCGGSMVVTVPSEYIEGYGLDKYVRSKNKLKFTLRIRD